MSWRGALADVAAVACLAAATATVAGPAVASTGHRDRRTDRGAAAAGAQAAAAPTRPADAAQTAEVATLNASFTPDRLGASTTIGFGFSVHTTTGLAPPPLSSLDLRMPAGMDYVSTTLGLAICHPRAIIAHGGKGCPVNSRLGYGSAYVEVPFGSGAGHELPRIEAFMGPPVKEDMVVLFYVNGQIPVFAQLVFSGTVLPDSGPFGTQLEAKVPLVESVPEGPDVSIVRAQSTIGPRHVLYRRISKGRVHYFHPQGIAVPEHCPAGGFPFSASFTFQDGSHAEASTTVPCPKPRHGNARRHRAHGAQSSTRLRRARRA